MQEALRINDADSVTVVTGNIKLPTGEVGDKNITLDQIKGYTNEGVAAEEHTHEIGDVNQLEEALNGKANAEHDHAIENIDGLQSALDALEPTITATTAADYYRGDKTFQTLNKAAVGLPLVDNTADANKPVSAPQAVEFNKKIEELDSPAAGGMALNMAKVGTLAKLKKLLQGQDITLTDNGDSITIAATGRTLKEFTESSYTANGGKVYKEFIPILPSGADVGKAVHLRLGGRLNGANVYSMAVTDSASTYGNVNTGNGSVDLQIVRTNANQTASGTNSFAAGQNNQVSGSNTLGLAMNTAVNTISAANSVAIIGGGAGATTVSGTGSTVIAGGGTYSGTGSLVIAPPLLDNGNTGNANVLLGAGHGVTGNNSSAVSCGNSFSTRHGSRGMQAVHIQTNCLSSAIDWRQQNLTGMYSHKLTTADAGVWKNLTSDRLTAGTTNVYNIPSGTMIAFYGYAEVHIGGDYKVFRIEGCIERLVSSTLTYTATQIGGNVVADNGEFQLVIVSTQYLHVQVRHGATASVGSGAGLSTLHANCNLNFFELF